MSLTDPVFFDTDCLSAFLWVNNQSLLAQLYPGRIVIPAEVYAELSRPSIPHLKARIDILLSNNDVELKAFSLGLRSMRSIGSWWLNRIRVI